MNNLHLTIIAIVILVGGTCFFINEGATACNYCAMIPFPPQSAPPPITVETNLQNYTVADTIIVSGHLSNPNGKSSLVIKVYDHFHQERAYKFFPVWTNKTYTWAIPPASFLSSGNYTVLSQYGQDYATSHFFLNYDIEQYLKTLSPLQQRKMFPGTLPQDFHCRSGFQFIIKAEDSSPVCVHPLTATKLMLWGWALGPPPKVPYVNRMSINLKQNYTVGQVINTTVTYSGYYVYIEPEVRILDASGKQIWFNCPFCSTRTEPIQSPSYKPFTYYVREYSTNALPIINKTGTYTMTASLDNKIADANFTVISNQTLLNQNSDQPTGHTDPRSTIMKLQVWGSYDPGSLYGHFLKGNLDSIEGPIPNQNVTIYVNDIDMGQAVTDSSGCFQFNSWDDKKLSSQTNDSRKMMEQSGVHDAMNLNIFASYLGDESHNAANATAQSYLYLWALPLPPQFYDTNVTPSQINLTAGKYTTFQVSVKPFVAYDGIPHMKLHLGRLPCGVSYNDILASDNDTASTSHPAIFNFTVYADSQTLSGKYFLDVNQNPVINRQYIGTNVGGLVLNVLKDNISVTK